MSMHSDSGDKSLLLTKIRVPPASSRTIARRPLLKRLLGDSDTRLILLSAPAGYGKTSLLVDFAHQRANAGERVIWYLLDATDDDPARFSAYLTQAFAEAALFDPAQSGAGPPTDLLPTITSALNAISGQASLIWLVLDDYHQISSPHIHHAVSRLCEFMPLNLRLIIGTRADPPLSLARIKTQGHLVELRMSDLRFDAGEITRLLAQTMTASLSAASVQKVEAITEGWAAALALFCMQAPRDGSVADEHFFDRQIAAFTQTNDDLFDYFALEVLKELSADDRAFLFATCVLERLTPELCVFITGQVDAGHRLRMLARANLFIVPIGGDTIAFRYHPLFADFLRDSLRLHDPNQLCQNHRRAAEWYAGHDLFAEAVAHALESADWEWVASLIEARAWPALTARGEIVTILRWLGRFPEAILDSFPRLLLYYSRALYLTGDIDRSQTLVTRAFAVIETSPHWQDNAALRAIACNYGATLCAYRGEIDAGLRLSEEATRLSASVASLDRVRIANTDAFLHFVRGDVRAARRGYEQAHVLAQAQGHTYLRLDATSYLLYLDLQEGHLHETIARATQTLADYASPIAPLSAVFVPLAIACYRQNRLDRAEELLREAIDLASGALVPDVLWIAHAWLALTLAAAGRGEEAKQNATLAAQIASRFHSPFISESVAAVQALLALGRGELNAAMRLLGAAANSVASLNAGLNETPAPPEYQRDMHTLALARVCQASGRHQEAVLILETLADSAARAGRSGVLAETELGLALAYRALGKDVLAREALRAALRRAAPEEDRRLFLDEGRALQPLLDQLTSERASADFVQRLLHAIAAAHPVEQSLSLLTARELEVLACIASGQSNHEIAEALVLSVGTVKSHINHIMTKLDTSNRTATVAKARSLGLLQV